MVTDLESSEFEKKCKLDLVARGFVVLLGESEIKSCLRKSPLVLGEKCSDLLGRHTTVPNFFAVAEAKTSTGITKALEQVGTTATHLQHTRGAHSSIRYILYVRKLKDPLVQGHTKDYPEYLFKPCSVLHGHEVGGHVRLFSIVAGDVGKTVESPALPTFRTPNPKGFKTFGSIPNAVVDVIFEDQLKFPLGSQTATVQQSPAEACSFILSR